MKKADFARPEEINVGDTIEGKSIVEIRNTVNGKPTYASTFVVGVNQYSKISDIHLPEEPSPRRKDKDAS